VDVKDSVFAFLPKTMRALVARQYQRCSAVTVNSQLLLSSARFLTGKQATVVYSGVDSAFYGGESGRVRPRGEESQFVITLTGSLRSSVRLREFLIGCQRLRDRLAGKRNVQIVYAGHERANIEAMCKVLGIYGWIRFEDYLPTGALASLVRSADVNSYISAARAGFHHKFLELVSAGKPVIAYGGELEESLQLSNGVAAVVFDPAGPTALDVAFCSILGLGRRDTHHREPIAKFGWDEQARHLEAVFRRAIEEAR
jgi:glycosyltransferase involved in cell wall biosynthesis